jgi:predicted transcriptional regulator
MKNFHVPLPDDTYATLKAAAQSSKIPATALAREAIESRLREQRRRARYKAIASYAAATAGSRLDLDPVLERAGIGHLLKMGEGTE